MHKTSLSAADRAALENLWGDAGTWAADTWSRLNVEHFDGRLRYHGIVWGLTPHGHALAHTSNPDARITLHPSLLDPRPDEDRKGGWVWKQERRLGARHAADVLLHEMIHVALFAHDIPNTKEAPHHNAEEWCAEIVRITPQLGLPAVTAAPVKPRRVDGKVKRQELDGNLSRDDAAHWPHSIRPAGFYNREGRITVPI
jgi:hypothetical protein